MRFVMLMLLALHVEADNMSSLLYNGNCVACHKDTKAVSAPSMKEIRTRYKQVFENKKDFVSYMSKWVIEPDEQTSLMHDAIDKYGLMPHLAFDEQTLVDISSYIYETDFTKHGGRYWSK